MQVSYEFDLNKVDVFKLKCPRFLSILFSLIWMPQKNQFFRNIQHKFMHLMQKYLEKQNNKEIKSTYEICLNNVEVSKFEYKLDFQFFRENDKCPEILVCSIAYILRDRIDVMLDIGSNLGLISAQISQFNPKIRIYAYEPQFECAEISRRIYSSLNADSTVFQIALGSNPRIL